jgi:hypothetical protein
MKTIFAEGPMTSQKERGRILWQMEMSRDEKSARSQKTRESANQPWDGMEPLVSWPFPLKEKAEPGRIIGQCPKQIERTSAIPK